MNVWKFRQELTESRPWDFNGTLLTLRRSLQSQEEWMSKYSNEFEPMLNKKLYYMRRAIYLLNNLIESDFHPLAEARLNKKYVHDRKFEFKKLDDGNYEMVSSLTQEESENNREIYLESAKIENEFWIELFEILKGDTHQYDLIKSSSNKSYEEFHSGKGLNNWWN